MKLGYTFVRNGPENFTISIFWPNNFIFFTEFSKFIQLNHYSNVQPKFGLLRLAPVVKWNVFFSWKNRRKNIWPNYRFGRIIYSAEKKFTHTVGQTLQWIFLLCWFLSVVYRAFWDLLIFEFGLSSTMRFIHNLNLLLCWALLVWDEALSNVVRFILNLYFLFIGIF